MIPQTFGSVNHIQTFGFSSSGAILLMMASCLASILSNECQIHCCLKDRNKPQLLRPFKVATILRSNIMITFNSYYSQGSVGSPGSAGIPGNHGQVVRIQPKQLSNWALQNKYNNQLDGMIFAGRKRKHGTFWAARLSRRTCTYYQFKIQSTACVSL